MSVVLPGTSATPTVGPLHRRTFLAAAGAGALTVAGAGTAAQASTGSAPVRVATVVLNGRVFTGAQGGTPAQAVAVGSDGKVLAVGRNTDICRRIGPRTVVIDADGGTVMPGIQDGHMHPLGAAAQSLNPSLGNMSMTVSAVPRETPGVAGRLGGAGTGRLAPGGRLEPRRTAARGHRGRQVAPRLAQHPAPDPPTGLRLPQQPRQQQGTRPRGNRPQHARPRGRTDRPGRQPGTDRSAQGRRTRARLRGDPRAECRADSRRPGQDGRHAPGRRHHVLPRRLERRGVRQDLRGPHGQGAAAAARHSRAGDRRGTRQEAQGGGRVPARRTRAVRRTGQAAAHHGQGVPRRRDGVPGAERRPAGPVPGRPGQADRQPRSPARQRPGLPGSRTRPGRGRLADARPRHR